MAVSVIVSISVLHPYSISFLFWELASATWNRLVLDAYSLISSWPRKAAAACLCHSYWFYGLESICALAWLWSCLGPLGFLGENLRTFPDELQLPLIILLLRGLFTGLPQCELYFLSELDLTRFVKHSELWLPWLYDSLPSFNLGRCAWLFYFFLLWFSSISNSLLLSVKAIFCSVEFRKS